LIKTSGKSLREVAVISGIPKSTLCDYSKRFPDFLNLTPDIKIKPTFHHLQVLKPTHEQELTDYLNRTPKSHGLTPQKLKLLVYSYAVFNGIPIPPTWVRNKTAGKDGFNSFLKRKKRLSIRKPEATSQARVAALKRAIMN
jgi:hypothetical protein